MNRRPSQHFWHRAPLALLLCWGAGALACTPANWPAHQPPRPSLGLESILREWDALHAGGVDCEGRGLSDPPPDCERLRAELERLQLERPTDPALQLAAGVLEWESGAPQRAQAQLDALLQRDPAHARAASLRARLALDEGNTPFALHLLERTVHLVPDDPGLRETEAAVAFADRDWERAEHALRAAERLGAPAWRLAYHWGLLAEGRGRLDAADEHYRRALLERPDWELPRRRIRGLWAEAALPQSVQTPAPVSAPEPEWRAQPPAAPAPRWRATEPSGYLVQLPLLDDARATDRRLEQLADAGYPAIRLDERGAGGLRHRIRVGPYSTHSDALRVRDELERWLDLTASVLRR